MALPYDFLAERMLSEDELVRNGASMQQLATEQQRATADLKGKGPADGEEEEEGDEIDYHHNYMMMIAQHMRYPVVQALWKTKPSDAPSFKFAQLHTQQKAAAQAKQSPDDAIWFCRHDLDLGLVDCPECQPPPSPQTQ